MNPAAVYGAPLSAREIEVLGLRGRGLKAAEVAQKLGISYWTVKGHLAAVYEKLDKHTCLEALTAACRLGLLAWHSLEVRPRPSSVPRPLTAREVQMLTMRLAGKNGKAMEYKVSYRKTNVFFGNKGGKRKYAPRI